MCESERGSRRSREAAAVGIKYERRQSGFPHFVTHTYFDSLWGKQLRAVLDAAQRCAIVVGLAHHEAVVIVASVKKLRIDV